VSIEPFAGRLPVRRFQVVVSSTSSDAHTWNLAYLELLLEELGCEVTNLGACTPDEVVIAQCEQQRCDLLVISTLNGHGGQDGARLIRAVRARSALAALPAVIGGKLDVAGGDGSAAEQLVAAGFDAAFEDGSVGRFCSFVSGLALQADEPMVIA
jgi:methylaspartate mutase sigma subunit